MTYQRTNYKILILIVCNLLEKNDGIVALIGPSELKLSLQMANLASSVWIFMYSTIPISKSLTLPKNSKLTYVNFQNVGNSVVSVQIRFHLDFISAR